MNDPYAQAVEEFDVTGCVTPAMKVQAIIDQAFERHLPLIEGHPDLLCNARLRASLAGHVYREYGGLWRPRWDVIRHYSHIIKVAIWRRLNGVR